MDNRISATSMRPSTTKPSAIGRMRIETSKRQSSTVRRTPTVQFQTQIDDMPNLTAAPATALSIIRSPENLDILSDGTVVITPFNYDLEPHDMTQEEIDEGD